jgi:hypothetical protein
VGKSYFGRFSFFILFRAFFIVRSLLPLAYKKQTLPLFGWSQKYLSINYCDFLTPTDAVTQKIKTDILSLRNVL